MMYYNKVTYELSSAPPWGNSFLLSAIISKRYPDWEQVEDSFIPPETTEVVEAEVSQSEIEMAEAIVEIYDILEESDKDADL